MEETPKLSRRALLASSIATAGSLAGCAGGGDGASTDAPTETDEPPTETAVAETHDLPATVAEVAPPTDEGAPQEVLLVLDASTGQNALSQAQHFQEAVGVTGLILTKLDGTAKGGVIFAIAHRLGLPIRYIGVGERPEDLQPFRAEEFVDALLGDALGAGQ
jgi:hypothetical protein